MVRFSLDRQPLEDARLVSGMHQPFVSGIHTYGYRSEDAEKLLNEKVWQ